MKQLVAKRWPRVTVLVLTGLSAYACSGDRVGGSGSDADHLGVPLSSELVLGADYDAPPEYQLAEVRDLLPLSDGSVWVLDRWGPVEMMQFSIRRFDAQGRFTGFVSSMGDGPGEFRIPQALVELSDGRVLLRDQRRPERLTIFSADGVLDEEVRTEHGFAPAVNGTAVVDDLGRIWLWSSTQARPGPNRPPAFWAIVGSDGALLDTIHPPALPVLNDERLAWVSDDGRGILVSLRSATRRVASSERNAQESRQAPADEGCAG
jgi:hypothetical protein